MKLFAIRIENGQTIGVLAASQEQALRNANLTEDILQQLEAEGTEFDRALLVEDGLGPQRFELIELSHFQMGFGTDERGDLQVTEIEDATAEALYSLYPILDKAIEEAAKRWSGLDRVSRSHHQNWVRAAIDREKMRLMLPPETEFNTST